MITITNLQKYFGTFPALNGIDLHVSKGEIYGFIGRNGAGKSTTMNILAGLSKPGKGICLVNGKDISTIRHPSDLGIGYLPEDPKFYSWMNAYETLEYLGNGQENNVDKIRIMELLDWVGLTESTYRRVGGFSRGMRQRLGIAAAFVLNPDLLILDEPSSALDPEGRSDILSLITELKQMGKTVLFSSHILSDVERICDTIGIIEAGKMIMQKPLSLIRKENLVPIYDITLPSACRPETVELLKNLESVSQIVMTGNSLSVTVKDATLASKRLMRFFADEEIAVDAFTLRENGLEDIFLKEVNGK